MKAFERTDRVRKSSTLENLKSSDKGLACLNKYIDLFKTELIDMISAIAILFTVIYFDFQGRLRLRTWMKVLVP